MRRHNGFSIFVSILFPLLLSIVMINVIVTASIRPHTFGGGPPHGRRDRATPEIVNRRLEAIRHAVESEPTLEAFRRAVGEEPLDAVFDGPGGGWKTRPELPDWAALTRDAHPETDDQGEMHGRYAGRPFHVREIASGRLAVIFPQGGMFNGSPLTRSFFWITLALEVSLALLLCWAILYWQLRPLRALDAGVAELSHGNLDHRMDEDGAAEFRSLAGAFNEMADKVGRMIHAKEELVLGVSHELRSPIASLKVLVELLKDGKRKEQMKASLSQMESMVTDLLDSHRIASTHGGVRIGTIVVKSLFLLTASRYPKRVKWTVEPEGLVLPGDLPLIDRLLSNLVENALKYSPKAPIEVSARGEAGTIRIEVRDSGPGIPKAELEAVFEPFYRVDKSRNKETGGYGLGLYLCKRIVEAHRGSITATNRPEGGCVITVTLPGNARLS